MNPPFNAILEIECKILSFAAKNMGKLKFNCNISWLFREHDFTERFKLAADAGFKGRAFFVAQTLLVV